MATPTVHNRGRCYSNSLTLCRDCTLSPQHSIHPSGTNPEFTMLSMRIINLMWTSLLLIQPLYLQLHTYKDPSQDLVPNNLTIRYFRFLELFLIYMRI